MNISSGPPLPQGACDCHTHVFLDELEFPFWKSRKYTPPMATVEALSAVHASLGIQRVVIVQPSVYAADNSATLHALRMLGNARARAVVVIDEATPDAQLAEMTAAGVRGVRVNLEIDGERDAAKAALQLKRVAERIAPHGWHAQIYASMPLIAACRDVIESLPVPVVLDHFAGAQAGKGAEQEGIDAVLALVKSGKAYVKLSAAYRCSVDQNYPELEPLARRLIDAKPERMLWGSDWPHPQPGTRADPAEVSPPFVVDLAHVLDLLRQWTPDDATFKQILARNPERLYGFNAGHNTG